MQPFKPEEFLILIVDDARINIQVLVLILEKVGYATTFAKSGKLALKRVKTAQPDLILLDLMMPQMNGLEVCEILKADPKHWEIPIIFLSASHEQDNLLQAFDLGAADYITKPFNTPELLARVRTHLQLRKFLQEQIKLTRELEKLATTDVLTGVPNRRHILKLAKQELNHAAQSGDPFSILLLDLDRFKQVNDTYGHGVGDEVLKAMAQTTVHSLRKLDYFGRFGGEEFVAVLPETNRSQALIVADRIRHSIADLSLQVEAQILKITVSIGIGTYKSSDRQIEEVLKRADDALYEAKRRGRNQVFSSD